MNVRMICLDMDGTLLQSDGTISVESKQRLIQAQEQGIKVVLASGRNFNGLNKYGEQLHLRKYGGYYAGVNGQQITNVATGHTEYLSKVEISTIVKAFNLAKEYDLEFLGVNNDTIYNYYSDRIREKKYAYKNEHNITDSYMTAGVFHLVFKQNYPFIFDVLNDHDFPEPVNKIVFAEDPEILGSYHQILRDQLAQELQLTFTSSRWLEGSPYGISKGNAIKMLCEKENIDLSEVMVFGDAENDRSMFELPTLSIAMGNGMDRIKEIADFVTESNDDEGIAVALRRFL